MTAIGRKLNAGDSEGMRDALSAAAAAFLACFAILCICCFTLTERISCRCVDGRFFYKDKVK